jgi:hypothetical protein
MKLHYQITEGVLARSVGDAMVLFQPETERLLTLNGTGSRIWDRLSYGDSAAQIVDLLVEEYDGSVSLIRQQTLEFLAQLEGEKVIRRHAFDGPGRKGT